MKQILMDIITALLSIGNINLNALQIRQLRLLNGIAGLGLISALINLLVYITMQIPMLIIIHGVGICIFIQPILFNAFSHHQIARLTASIIIPFYYFISAILCGKEFGFEYAFFITALPPLMYYQSFKRGMIFAAYNFVLLIICKIVFGFGLFAPLVNVGFRIYVLLFNVVTAFCVLIGVILVYKAEISAYQGIVERQNRNLAVEQERSEALLLNVLPAPIAIRLKAGEQAIADHYDAVTVLFADIVGFTKSSQTVSAQVLVEGLNEIFAEFDALAIQHGLEKIKTIGDAYMVAGGLPERDSNHVERVACFALAMQEVIQKQIISQSALGTDVQMRIGIHTGEAVAGIIGTSKFAYDLWGDTVNTASRMESHGEAGRIHCSEEMYEALKEKFLFEERGEIEIKGKGLMRTWFLKGIRHTVPQGA